MYTKFRIQYKMNGLLLNHLELNSFPAFIVPDHFIFIIIVMFFFSSAVEKVSCFFFISSWTLICWTKMNAFFCCCPGSLYYCCCFQFIKKLSSIACGILFGKFGLLKKNLNIRIVTLNLCYELKHEKKVNERHSKWKKKNWWKTAFPLLRFLFRHILPECSGPLRIYRHFLRIATVHSLSLPLFFRNIR